MRCRTCGQSSQHTVLGSTNAFGSPDLDLRPPEMQRLTMGCWLQLCPHCGYCVPDLPRSGGDRAVLGSPGYRAVLADRRLPELSCRFLAHGLLVERTGPEAAAHDRLHAAWACDDARRPEDAVECQLQAAADMERLKPFEETEEGLSRGAILIDILRRAGQLERAGAECQALLARPSVEGVIRQVLEFQRRLIASGDRASHSVAEARKGD